MNNGIEMPAVGLGVFHSEPEITVAAVRTAVANGYRLILRSQIELGNSPIPKSVCPERIAENFDVFGFALISEEVHSIDALDTGERGGWDPDQVTLQTFS